MQQYVELCGIVQHCAAIPGIVRLYATICGKMRQCVEFCGIMRQYWELSGNMGHMVEYAATAVLYPVMGPIHILSFL